MLTGFRIGEAAPTYAVIIHIMDRIHSSDIGDIGKALGLMLEASPSEIEPHEKRLREMLGSDRQTMFGYTIGELAGMCLAKLEKSSGHLVP